MTITSITHGGAVTVPIIAITSIVGVHAITIAAPSSSTASTASPSTPASLVLGGHLLDGEGVAIDVGGALLHQLLGSLLPLKGDKSKVLWLIVLALVHGPHNLSHGAKGDKVSLNLLVGDSLSGKVAQVDLALLGLGLLARDLLALDHMSLLAGGGLNASAVLEQDEGKSPASASVGISLQIDVLNLSKLSKVFLDVSILGFLQ